MDLGLSRESVFKDNTHQSYKAMALRYIPDPSICIAIERAEYHCRMRLPFPWNLYRVYSLFRGMTSGYNNKQQWPLSLLFVHIQDIISTKTLLQPDDLRHQFSIAYKSPAVMHSDLLTFHLYSSNLTFNLYPLQPTKLSTR